MAGNEARQRVSESASQKLPTLVTKTKASQRWGAPFRAALRSNWGSYYPTHFRKERGKGWDTDAAFWSPSDYLTRMVQMLPVVSVYSYTIWSP